MWNLLSKHVCKKIVRRHIKSWCINQKIITNILYTNETVLPVNSADDLQLINMD